MLAQKKIFDDVEQVYGERPSPSQMRKLMKKDPSLKHSYLKSKNELNRKFDPTGEFEEMRYKESEEE